MKLDAKTDVEIGGRKRALCLTMNTLSEVELALNVNLMSGGEEFFKSMTFTKMRVIVWAMLYKEKPRPTVEEVGEWISETGLESISEAIGKLFTLDTNTESTEPKSKKASDPMKG